MTKEGDKGKPNIRDIKDDRLDIEPVPGQSRELVDDYRGVSGFSGHSAVDAPKSLRDFPGNRMFRQRVALTLHDLNPPPEGSTYGNTERLRRINLPHYKLKEPFT